jgi:hypothetical protein
VVNIFRFLFCRSSVAIISRFCSLDEAQRNPGLVPAGKTLDSALLHPGYLLAGARYEGRGAGKAEVKASNQ